MRASLKLLLAPFFLFLDCYSLLGFESNHEKSLCPEGAVPYELDNIEQRKKPTTVDSVGKMRIAYVDRPTLTVYEAPKQKANGTGVIICPGGGYNILAWTHEGVEIAQWLNSIGVSAFILKYRVPRRDPDQPHTLRLQDAQRAIRIVRSNAKEWNVDSKRIGLLGFSAGGHLTVMSGVHYNCLLYTSDAADE